MSEYKIAFFIGLFSSVHCIGMCGPLALAIPLKGNGIGGVIGDKLLYNLGRVITYSLLGVVSGLIGRQLWLAGLQQAISIISGIIILLVALERLFAWQTRLGFIAITAMRPVNYLLAFALRKRYGHLIVGLINGLLPCGFVYMAMAGALTLNSVKGSMYYMFSFGMGTLPLMLVATVGGGYLNQGVRRHIGKTIPYFMVVLGIWFLLRGTHLNIPYLSPDDSNDDVSICK